MDDEEGGKAEDIRTVTAEDIVARARRTDAKVAFIEDASLLRDVGGVGALLRFRIAPRGEGSTPT